MVATAISELARNIVLYAKRGEIILAPVVSREHCGLVITAWDDGEGIADVRPAGSTVTMLIGALLLASLLLGFRLLTRRSRDAAGLADDLMRGESA
jgi:hypothetical protein